MNMNRIDFKYEPVLYCLALATWVAGPAWLVAALASLVAAPVTMNNLYCNWLRLKKPQRNRPVFMVTISYKGLIYKACLMLTIA